MWFALPRIVDLRDHHGNTARMYGQQALSATVFSVYVFNLLASSLQSDAYSENAFAYVI